MEVHPPHQSIHTWRDFFIHLITITIGLLIALGLEGLVEQVHHHNLVKQALADVQGEMGSNHGRVAGNLASLREDEGRIAADIKTLRSIRAGSKEKERSLDFKLTWNSFGDSAWKSTETSGAMVYLNFESQRDLAEVYDQQDLVSSRVKQLERDHAFAVAPFMISEDPEKMTPAETELSLQRAADLMMDLQTLEQWLQQLDKKYTRELAKLRNSHA